MCFVLMQTSALFACKRKQLKCKYILAQAVWKPLRFSPTLAQPDLRCSNPVAVMGTFNEQTVRAACRMALGLAVC